MTEAEIDAFFRARVQTTAPPYFVTAAERQRIVGLWLDGLAIKTIADYTGRSLPTVYRYIRAVKGPDATRTKRPRNERLAQMWNDGATMSDICASLSMNRLAVHSMVHNLRQRGIKMKLRQ